MLQSLLKYDGLPKAVLDQMETDWTSPARGVEPSGDGWFGHYAMGHWWECLGYGTPSERAELPPICTDAHIQAVGYYVLEGPLWKGVSQNTGDGQGQNVVGGERTRGRGKRGCRIT